MEMMEKHLESFTHYNAQVNVLIFSGITERDLRIQPNNDTDSHKKHLICTEIYCLGHTDYVFPKGLFKRHPQTESFILFCVLERGFFSV